ncbi:chaoptin [Dendroctonus ponderosae]|uniref:chaoptin n=1 Tax=Dendroctonus ponderosae TaxID=77166 RepID=UPI002034AE25|nr:chaoptin [Dendroctonus ponderosae]KAH1008424.1 hypothetical protein HUJ05_008978 [Dendroctonus ponderosae]
MDATRLVLLITCCCFFRRLPAHPMDYDSSSEEDENHPAAMEQAGKNLNQVLQGDFAITKANFAYNSISQLPAYVFYKNLYRNLDSVQLGHNKIAHVDATAFKELQLLRTLDLSSNRIVRLETNSFRHNYRLQKLDLAFNSISFDPERPFLKSLSIKTLVLSHNRIIHLYDITFARMPNLQTLLLDGNPLYYVSRNCFVYSRRLQYVSLANTGVDRLMDSMFRTVPRLVDLANTTLAKKFEPPLRKVKAEQLVKLMDFERRIFGDEDDVDDDDT